MIDVVIKTLAYGPNDEAITKPHLYKLPHQREARVDDRTSELITYSLASRAALASQELRVEHTTPRNYSLRQYNGEFEAEWG